MLSAVYLITIVQSMTTIPHSEPPIRIGEAEVELEIPDLISLWNLVDRFKYRWINSFDKSPMVFIQENAR
jgi:hypothetical protein